MEETLEETSTKMGKMRDWIMDKDLLKGEVEKIFEKANEDLLETVEKMREKQMSLFEMDAGIGMGFCRWVEMV